MSRRRSRDVMPPIKTPVSITSGEKTYTGHYTIARGMITVSYGSKSTTTQLGGTRAPDALAKVILSEMIPRR